MKKTIAILSLVFISFSVYSQESGAGKPLGDNPYYRAPTVKSDSVQISFFVKDLNMIYIAIDNSKLPHEDAKRLMQIIIDAYQKQVPPLSDSDYRKTK